MMNGPDLNLRIPQFLPGFNSSAGSDWRFDIAAQRLHVTALPHSEIFEDPGETDSVSSASRHNAATLMAPAPTGDFQFCAAVRVDFSNTFDAGVLLVRVNELTWAKLCFEFSPDREAMVVSVVNNGSVSDDANAFLVHGDQVHLRISRKGRVYVFHASNDGKRWVFVRAFAFDDRGSAEIGFESQSPNGEGCDVTFSDFSIAETTIADFRDGR